MIICINNIDILIDSIYRKDENYYPNVLLEKFYFIEDIDIQDILVVILMKNIMIKNV